MSCKENECTNAEAKKGSVQDLSIPPNSAVRRKITNNYEPTKAKMLNKKERSKIVTCIKHCSVLDSVKLSSVLKSFPIFKELVSREEVLTSLVEFHRQTFISLYTGNEKGVHFIPTPVASSL